MRRSLLPDLSMLATFEAAARHGNFSRAAEEMSLTQSAVSRQIKDLEARTGQRLFERIRQRVVLSEAGARALPEVRRLLTEAESLMLDTLAAGPVTQQLRIGTLPTFGVRWLVPRLVDFMALNPAIALTIESRDRPFSFDEDPLDLTIHYGKPVWPGAVADFLCTEVVVPVASRAMATRIEPTPEGLAEAPLLHLLSRPRLWMQWFDLYGNGAPIYRGQRFDQFSMLIAAAISGLGVGLLPTYLVERELASGDLVQLLDAPMETDNAYYVVMPEDRQNHQASKLFRDWILGQIGTANQTRTPETKPQAGKTSAR
ncbi:LysR substrate-binding domain-containing protein [Pontitalea aquivivens]|uniref:LysR substrate-binding domain-containing protein n=1 Tax=Pontitalea aquivivens TaxID=3388663 RepID=UPI003970E1B7